MISGNIVDGAANGISIVNFNEGGRMAVCSAATSCAICRRKAPTVQDPPGFGVGIGVEADTAVTGNVIENAPLYGMQIGWGPYMRNVVATGNVIRKRRHGHRRHGGRRRRLGGDLRQCDRRGPEGAIVGYRWAEPATGDLAEGTAGYADLTDRAQPRELRVHLPERSRSEPALGQRAVGRS